MTTSNVNNKRQHNNNQEATKINMHQLRSDLILTNLKYMLSKQVDFVIKQGNENCSDMISCRAKFSELPNPP